MSSLAAPTGPLKSPRSVSLDVFRGATVALMILVNNPGSWSHLYSPLAHANWHGCTLTDLVFPFFLFAVGNALAFVLPGLRDGPPSLFWRKVLQRTLLIFALGLFLNISPFVRWNEVGELVPRKLEFLRWFGVLQRIALAYGCAAVVVWWGGRRGAVVAAVLLLLGYWIACLLLGAPGDPFSLEGFFGTSFDRWLLGARHLYQGEGVAFDPEGPGSTPPAIAQVLIGYLAGDSLRRVRVDMAQVARLLLAATALLAAGWAWSLWMPLNKKLWTSSYVLHTSGLALMALAVLVHAFDLQAMSEGTRRRLHPLRRLCENFGRNALFVFVLSGFLPRVLALWRWPDAPAADGHAQWLSPLPWLYKTLFAPLGEGVGDPRFGSLLFALANLAFYAAIVGWMDSRRIYVRV
jgi:predicted acyltransferase